MELLDDIPARWKYQSSWTGPSSRATPVLMYSDHLGSSNLPPFFRCSAYALMKAAALTSRTVRRWDIWRLHETKRREREREEREESDNRNQTQPTKAEQQKKNVSLTSSRSQTRANDIHPHKLAPTTRRQSTQTTTRALHARARVPSRVDVCRTDTTPTTT